VQLIKLTKNRSYHFVLFLLSILHAFDLLIYGLVSFWWSVRTKTLMFWRWSLSKWSSGNTHIDVLLFVLRYSVRLFWTFFHRSWWTLFTKFLYNNFSLILKQFLNFLWSFGVHPLQSLVHFLIERHVSVTAWVSIDDNWIKSNTVIFGKRSFWLYQIQSYLLVFDLVLFQGIEFLCCWLSLVLF
jgi:hypothetical protein